MRRHDTPEHGGDKRRQEYFVGGLSALLAKATRTQLAEDFERRPRRAISAMETVDRLRGSDLRTPRPDAVTDPLFPEIG